MGKLEFESCLFCKEIDTQVYGLLYYPSTMQLWNYVENRREKISNLITKTCDWDKVFGNPKSSIITNDIVIPLTMLTVMIYSTLLSVKAVDNSLHYFMAARFVSYMPIYMWHISKYKL